MKNIKERKWLTKARKEKDLTQKQLGEMIGVSDNAITQYEKGIRMPKPNILNKLCEILDISISEFYKA